MKIEITLTNNNNIYNNNYDDDDDQADKNNIICHKINKNRIYDTLERNPDM